VIVYGVEGASFEPGEQLSVPVARAAENLAQTMLGELAVT
jgi:hypothetical protein